MYCVRETDFVNTGRQCYMLVWYTDTVRRYIMQIDATSALRDIEIQTSDCAKTNEHANLRQAVCNIDTV